MGLFPALFSGTPSAPLPRPLSPGARGPLSLPSTSRPRNLCPLGGSPPPGLWDPFGRLCPSEGLPGLGSGLEGTSDPQFLLRGLPLDERVMGTAPFGLCAPHLPSLSSLASQGEKGLSKDGAVASCQPGFSSEAYVFRVPRRDLERGRMLGRGETP